MVYIIGYVYISIFIILTLIKSMIAYFRVKQSGDILFETRNSPVTLLESIYVVVVVIVFAYIMVRGFGQSYLLVLYFALYCMMLIFLESKLLITHAGIYYKSQYVTWGNIQSLFVEKSDIVIIKKSSLFKKIKINSLKDQYQVLEILDAYIKKSVEQ